MAAIQIHQPTGYCSKVKAPAAARRGRSCGRSQSNKGRRHLRHRFSDRCQSKGRRRQRLSRCQTKGRRRARLSRCQTKDSKIPRPVRRALMQQMRMQSGASSSSRLPRTLRLERVRCEVACTLPSLDGPREAGQSRARKLVPSSHQYFVHVLDDSMAAGFLDPVAHRTSCPTRSSP